VSGLEILILEVVLQKRYNDIFKVILCIKTTAHDGWYMEREGVLKAAGCNINIL